MTTLFHEKAFRISMLTVIPNHLTISYQLVNQGTIYNLTHNILIFQSKDIIFSFLCFCVLFYKNTADSICSSLYMYFFTFLN